MMRKPAICACLVLSFALPCVASQIIDRIVATVNGHIVLQSDWDDAVRYEAFMAGQLPGHATAAERKGALDRLIDQELLREQMRASDAEHAVTPEAVASRIAEIRKQYPGTKTGQGWQALLAQCGLQEKELKVRIAQQLELMRLVDDRLRPSVQIDAKSVEAYYNQSLLPQLRQSGAKAVPLAEAIPKIKELLTQQKVNQLLTAWLQNLRADSEIHSPFSPSAVGDQTR
jgi:peptidyl-prolyl cis-trans isomerase SurA